MESPAREIPKLELALLRRGLADRSDGCERCERCRRTPLIGERVYMLDSGAVVCELCHKVRRDGPAVSRLVHGPAFGHTMRIIDQRGRAA